MNQLVKKLSIISLTIFIVSCGGGNVDLVKTGIFDDYKNTTVGKAFDAWGVCDQGTTWGDFETDNGTMIVEYKCNYLNSKKVAAGLPKGILSGQGSVEKANEFFKNFCAGQQFGQMMTNPLQTLSGQNEIPECNLTFDRYIRSLATPSSIDVQFTINLDDTFQVTYVGASMGSYSTSSVFPDMDAFLDMVMNNNVFDQNAVDVIVSNAAMYARDGDMVSTKKGMEFSNLK
tara:strand:+ start:3491 stop:4180 length:690 start_codon:yes stop_codon:yes gene_type:complete